MNDAANAATVKALIMTATYDQLAKTYALYKDGIVTVEELRLPREAFLQTVIIGQLTGTMMKILVDVEATLGLIDQPKKPAS